jgi:hypothetical protein
MLQEIFFAPFKQTNRFRSPDVALFPLVAGSTHAVMMPLWTPGLGPAPFLADATETITISDITAVVVISQIRLGDFAM